MKRARRDAGFTIAGLICLMTALAITSAVMVPLRVMQTKREQEKELIFRGEEYVRAIRKYQRKYQAYPAAIDDLLTRDGFRFLRKQYKDPISGEDFRLINVNADGTLTGSVTMLALPVNTQPGAGGGFAPGNIGGTAGQLPTAGGTTNTGGQSGQANTNNVGNIGGLGGGMSSGGTSGINGVSSSPFASGGGGQNNANGLPQGVGGGVGSGVGTGTGGAFGGGSFGGSAMGIGGSPVGIGGTAGNNQNPGNTNNAGGGGAFGGGVAGAAGGAGARTAIGNNALTGGGATAQISPGLAGVGSQSTGTAVMVYNTKDKYNEWEFITPLEQTAGPSGAGGGAGPGGGGTRPGGTGPGSQPGSGVGGGAGFGVGGGGGAGVGGNGGAPFGGGGGQQGGNRTGTGTTPAGGNNGGAFGGGTFGGTPAGVGTGGRR